MFKKVISGVLIVLLSMSFAACGKSAKDEVDKGTVSGSETSSTDKKVKEESDEKINLGKTEGREYINDFFDMKIKVPDNWIIATDEEKQAIVDTGKQVVTGDDEKKSKEYDLSLERTVYLLVTSEKGMNVQDITNPNFMTLAEKISFFQGVKDGKDYLEEVKKGLGALSAQIPYTFDKEIYVEKVDDKEFYVLEAVVNGTGVTMTQKYYSSITNGYALCFITTSYSEEQSKSLETIIKSVSFE
jgi:hypothetical protein